MPITFKTLEGKPIEDANKDYTLNISKDDIRKGLKKTPSGCAAAIALTQTAGYKEARVHMGRTYVFTGKKWLRFMTPAALNREIVSFDRGGTFEPGDYTFKAPSAGQRLGARQERFPSKRRQIPNHKTENVREKAQGPQSNKTRKTT